MPKHDRPWLRSLSAAGAGFALACAAPAFGAEGQRLKLSLGGYGTITGAYVDQDTGPFDSFRNFGLAYEAEVHLRGKVTLDNGLHVGFHAELELGRDNPDLFATPEDQDFVEEAFVSIEDWWGRVQFGAQDGAADQMGLFSPTVARGSRINDGEISFIQDGFSPTPFRPIVLRTDLYASDDNLKLIYFTPRIEGFQAGLSYMPEGSKGFSGFTSRIDDDAFQQGDIVEAGLSWQGRIGTLDLAIAGTVLQGANESPTFFGLPPGFDDDLFEWGAGANLGFNLETVRVIVGGSYKNTNATANSIFPDATGTVFDDAETEIWELGATAARGPFLMGLSYINGESEVLSFAGPSGFSTVEGEAVEIAGGYILGPGVQMTLGFQHWRYEQDAALGAFFTGDQELEASILYFETALTL